jgi:predicted small lipoprotein YifL
MIRFRYDFGFPQPMRRLLQLLIIALSGLGLTACGTKGPLVLPKQPAPAETPAAPANQPIDDSKGTSAIRQ